MTSRRALAAFLALSLFLSACGAAAIVSALPTVITAVSDAILILDQIESFTTRYFSAVPDPERQAKVREAMGRARSALTVALRSSRAAKALSEQEQWEALAEFRAAYAELLKLVQPLGVVQHGEEGLLALSPQSERLVVPEPLALRAEGCGPSPAPCQGP